MSLSWHNFFFGAFDPSGALAVDKPPVDLWLQVASVKLFGFSPRSLVLPAAIAGTIAVPLLYDAVRRLFGTVAGLCAGAALAVMPVSVVASRSDALDSLMMMLALLALWLVVLAVQRGRARYLYLAAMVMGLDFNVKLFEALVPLPAIALLYLLASREGVRRRIEHLAAAGALFVAVSISWAAAVSLSPAHSRPFPIGSTDGSVWNVIFVYNGLNRLSPPASTAAVHSHSSKLGLFAGTPGAHLAPELVASAMLGLLALDRLRPPRVARPARGGRRWIALDGLAPHRSRAVRAHDEPACALPRGVHPGRGSGARHRGGAARGRRGAGRLRPPRRSR